MFYVLGADGFVGSAFCRHFEEAGIDFRPITRQNYARYASTKCDVLINANGSSNKILAARDPMLDFELNVRNTLDSLVGFDCDLYVLLSAINVYNDTSDPKNNHEAVPIRPEEISNYGFSKYLAELCVKKYSRNWLIVRLCGLVGEGLKKNPIYDLLHSQRLWVSPQSTYHYLNSADAVRLIYRMISDGHRNEVFNLCGDGVITLRELQDMLGIPHESSDMPMEYYNINIQKVKALYDIPSTSSTIRAFLNHHKERHS